MWFGRRQGRGGLQEQITKDDRNSFIIVTVVALSTESNDDVTKSLQSYMKRRQVPEFKEGDCAKLTILRQRLVARR